MFSKKTIVILVLIIGAFIVNFVLACTAPPNGTIPIKDFEPERYVGTWYEIARLDHRFERNLSNVTARYTLRDDNKIDVFNQGLNEKTCQWQSIQGIASFRESKSFGSLAVSFFRPFYSGYHIIEIDRKNYFYAMVTGSNNETLWILAREPKLDDEIVNELLAKAKRLSFRTNKLIMVSHQRPKNCQ